MPFLDEVQNKAYYMVKPNGTWQEPPHANICNTHAANVTGSSEIKQCVTEFIGLPIGMMMSSGGLFVYLANTNRFNGKTKK